MSEPNRPTVDDARAAAEGRAEAAAAAEAKPETLGPPAAAEGSAGPSLGPTASEPVEAEARRPSVRSTDLPPYTRSLLRIRVPVAVTLARKRQALGKIVEMGPGSIIQFEKSCEELLDLSVGDHLIASGEAVKVGDKFGLRILSITLPGERFQPVKGQ